MKISKRAILAQSAAFAAIAISSPALAQDSDQADTVEGEENVIIVTGFKKSLQDSIDLKRNSSVVVDAVSAEDVGKFPDQNVAESLQRITGVAIDRSGGEGQFITVRGLGPEFNAVLLNGRTLATDNDGREFSFDVLSSDIIQTAEVYKSSQPSLQSGGIGAVVNVTTAKPIDRLGFNATISAAGIYEELSDEFGTDISGVLSWSNGNVGALFGASYSKRNAQIDRNLTNGFALRQGNPAIFAPESSSNLQPTDISEESAPGALDGGLPAGARLQQQVIFSRDDQERERLTLNGALQFNMADRGTLTFDGLYSKFEIDSFDTQFSGFFSPPFIDPVVDANGTVTSFSRPSLDFQARNPDIAGLVGASQNDNVLTSNNREAETLAFGANFEFEATDRLTIVADASYSKATRDGTNPFVVLGALAPTSPLIQSTSTSGISTITNINAADFVDTSIQRLHFVNVNRTRVDDEVIEFRFDGDWEVDAGPLTKISFGGISTDRSKSRDLFDNFADPDGEGPLSASNIFCAYCGYTVGFDESILNQFSFDGFLSGVEGADTVPSTILNASFADAFAQLNDVANINDPARTGGNTAALLAYLNGGGLDPVLGIYTPTFNASGSFEVEEQIYATYINAELGGEFGGGVPWSANFGARVAWTNVLSSGVDQPVVEFTANINDTQLEPILAVPVPTSVSNDYFNFLPSANFKVEPTADTVLRLSYARTVTRPTLTALGVANTFGGRSDAPLSGGGNPLLESFEADNFDISFEWYFDNLSYFSVAGFHKELGNFIQSETVLVPQQIRLFDSTGVQPDQIVTRDFADTRQRNGLSGSISGVELAFQKTFDNGFGGIVNYTYVTSSRDNAPAGDLGFNGFTPHTVNVTGFYENGPFAARVSYNYRDGFLVLGQAEFAEPRQREAFGQLDASASFELTDQFQIFAEGINILGEDTRDFSRFPNRLLTYTRTGARYTLGVRASF
ncbi:TonB-dependent receptor [Erythrobacter sp. F6033]|uniref:TonB-dependent receptor n=1 Tax=Erythrobacter sp. F6033 TaxID=2926401 RepID=UPI001FF4E12C|nr:TonB-dependent receptor [Erythrobacter sp. F6033]MCK0127755.1 TonB-dependent receptor [Erythrobacter sp. F6033]